MVDKVRAWTDNLSVRQKFLFAFVFLASILSLIGLSQIMIVHYIEPPIPTSSHSQEHVSAAETQQAYPISSMTDSYNSDSKSSEVQPSPASSQLSQLPPSSNTETLNTTPSSTTPTPPAQLASPASPASLDTQIKIGSTASISVQLNTGLQTDPLLSVTLHGSTHCLTLLIASICGG